MSVWVLVVDDESDVEMLFRQQFRRDLRQGRFLLEFALSASQALDRVEQAPDDTELIFVLADINMPGMTVLPQTRPCNVLSALGEPERALKHFQEGAHRSPRDPTLAAAYAQKGDTEAARASLEDALKVAPQLAFAWLKHHHYSNDPAYLKLAEATLYDGLRKAGLPE